MITWQDILFIVIQAVIVPCLIYVIRLAQRYAHSNMKNASVERALMLAGDAVCASVGLAGQTFVDSIKKEQGHLTPEQAKAAAGMALDKSLELLNSETKNILQGSLGDLEAYLKAKIEEEVRRTKA